MSSGIIAGAAEKFLSDAHEGSGGHLLVDWYLEVLNNPDKMSPDGRRLDQMLVQLITDIGEDGALPSQGIIGKLALWEGHCNYYSRLSPYDEANADAAGIDPEPVQAGARTRRAYHYMFEGIWKAGINPGGIWFLDARGEDGKFDEQRINSYQAGLMMQDPLGRPVCVQVNTGLHGFNVFAWTSWAAALVVGARVRAMAA